MHVLQWIATYQDSNRRHRVSNPFSKRWTLTLGTVTARLTFFQRKAMEGSIGTSLLWFGKSICLPTVFCLMLTRCDSVRWLLQCGSAVFLLVVGLEFAAKRVSVGIFVWPI